MKSELDLTNRIEAYLNDELSQDERNAFDELRKADPSIDHQFITHITFTNQLSQYGKQKKLQLAMDDIHSRINVQEITNYIIPQPSPIIQLWRRYKNDITIAASVAIFAMLTTLLATGFFKKANQSEYIAFRRAMSKQIDKIARSQNALIKNINGQQKPPSTPAAFGGTGFALSTNGYIATNYHVIKGADSVYIQNNAGESFKVKTVYVDPAYDLAVLQVVDPNFTSFNTLPYTLKKSTSDLGQSVYTIGFPRDDYVYGEGYLSSRTGYAGDTTAYQVSIPVNPGNSGGPLLDNKGNVIGIISGKQTQFDGAAFAIKSNFLLKIIEDIPHDSLTSKLTLSKRNGLAGLSRTDQIKKMQDYVFMVKVY